ncbi:hypothetical protein CN671_05300, partial [Bacillus toyonensis]
GNTGPTGSTGIGVTGPTGPTGSTGPGAIESAFRANKDVTQFMTAGTPITVSFTEVLFDFNGEYNGVDTFVPKQDGVYQINSNVVFAPNGSTGYSIRFDLLVNGITIAMDTRDTASTVTVTVATIYGLSQGDTVNLRISSSISGAATLFFNQQAASFSAARLPFTSPIP